MLSGNWVSFSKSQYASVVSKRSLRVSHAAQFAENMVSERGTQKVLEPAHGEVH